MSADLRFQGQANAWDSTIGYILFTLRQFRPGDLLEMGPRGQMVYPEADSGVPCIQAQLLRDNVVWLRLSDRPLILPNFFDLDADRMELDVWNYDGLAEDCTAGEFFSDDHGRIAEACVAWFRDRQSIADPGTLGCEFHFSPYRDPTLGEEGNTDSLASVVRRIEHLGAESEFSIPSLTMSVRVHQHPIDMEVRPGDGLIHVSESTLEGATSMWLDADALLEELNEQLTSIQCVHADDGMNIVVEATAELSTLTGEELRDLVVRVDSARDLISGEYDYDTDDAEVQVVVDWRWKHRLSRWENLGHE